MKSKTPIPQERNQTIRQAIVESLRDRTLTVGVLSQEIRKSEKELYHHLEQLQKSGVLKMTPPQCGSCGFVFESRDRPRKPGKCPKCKSTFIQEPSFALVDRDR